MKRFIIFLILSSFFSCKTEIKDHYEINVKAPGIHNGMRAYLKTANERGQMKNKDTAIVLDDTFSFKGIRNEPALEFLFIDGYPGYLPVIIENGEINITINKDSLETSSISGTTANVEYSKFVSKERFLNNNVIILTEQFKEATLNNSENKTELYKDIIGYRKELSNLKLDFIASHGNSYISAFLIKDMVSDKQMSITDIETKFYNLSKHVKASNFGKTLQESINKQKQLRQQQKAIQVGDLAPNFSSKTPEGKTLSLNDIKGKITIIDFWASWCGPCRRENPYLSKAYKQFHDKGLEIISISLDQNGQEHKWLKAIKDDNMTWHHVSNLKSRNDPIANLYGVRSIPATFILDEKGKVIAKNLRGTKLNNKLAELLF